MPKASTVPTPKVLWTAAPDPSSKVMRTCRPAATHPLSDIAVGVRLGVCVSPNVLGRIYGLIHTCHVSWQTP